MLKNHSRFKFALLAVAGFCATLTLGQMTIGVAEEPLTPIQAVEGETVDLTVSVRGVLRNAGKNYFTDRRLILQSPNGVEAKVELYVKGWLPFKATQSSTGEEQPPLVQSDFLDKEVILTGRVEVRPVKGVGVAKILVVSDAKIVEQ